MSPEDVARAHQFRPGFRLVDYGEVGLPIFRLTIEAVTLAQRAIPTIQEFALRCLALGETLEADIARMLGLKIEVVQGAMNALLEDGHITRVRGPGDIHIFSLTETGETRLQQDSDETPQEEMLVIDYDGVRRTALRLTGESVVRASELQVGGSVQIRPYPAEPPEVSELNIPEITKVIRRHRGEDFRRTVLALKRIIRRNNVFREAMGLVFANNTSQDVQVAFVVDGKLSESHERAFAERGGPRKMGFVRAINALDVRKRLERLVGKTMLRRLPDDAELATRRKEEAEALAAVAAIRPVAERVRRSRQSDPATAALAEAEERLQLARHALNMFEVRPLACYEQYELLDEALREARRSLIITSAGLQPTIMTGSRLRAVDALVAARTSIEIETVLNPTVEPRGGDHFDPLAELSKRAERGALSLRKGRQQDFYFLLQDDELAVISNRPFLGEVSRRSGFTRIEGLVTRRPELVTEIRAILEREVGPRVR